MTLKTGVEINGAKTEVCIALIICNDVFKEHNQNMVVTSFTDGKHSSSSLHYIGFAFDLRSRYFTDVEKQLVLKDLQDSLSSEFDIILEKDHFHIEFQPKT